MPMRLVLLLLGILAYCGCEQTKKTAEDESIPKTPAVCQFEALEQLDSESAPYPHSLQCIEGFFSRLSNGREVKHRIDCRGGGALNFDREKRYFKLYEDGKCPTEKALATCTGQTFKIYLYDSDLSKDLDHFGRYCSDFGGTMNAIVHQDANQNL